MGLFSGNMCTFNQIFIFGNWKPFAFGVRVPPHPLALHRGVVRNSHTNSFYFVEFDAKLWVFNLNY